ncbi:hypothetical protein [uncultured Tenacibaculum sp.]|uniref:hypothetical protein n=1 Tax=uncultured Tenacibaculum sp. TaxID=174713 RepID=UPI00260DBE50|nr:hypothetical protein [uncultured Tenacibaculum sp.]
MSLEKENKHEWGTVVQLKEVSKQLARYNDIQVYKEIRKPYDKRYLISGTKVVYIFLFFILTICFPYTFIFNNEKPTKFDFVFVDWKIVVYISLLIISIISCLYDILHQRYYRLIKITERKFNKTKVYYQIRKYISFKKSIDNINKEKVRWSVHKCNNSESKWYSDHDELHRLKPKKNFKSVKKAKATFDKLMLDKTITERNITREKTQIYKPSFFQFLKEKNEIFYFNPNQNYRDIAFFGFQLILIYSGYFMIDLTTTLHIILGIPLSLLTMFFVFVKFEILSSKPRCLRVIERKVQQGSYRKTSYHLQSCPLDKRMNSKYWKDINPNKIGNSNHGRYYTSYLEVNKEELIKLFTKLTKDGTIHIKEETIDY